MGQNILRSIEQAKKRTFWQEHLKSWQSSLMTATAYCREQGLSIDRFKYWQYRTLPKSRLTRAPQEFIEVTMTETTTNQTMVQASAKETFIMIETPLGYKITLPLGLTQSELHLVLSSLRQASC